MSIRSKTIFFLCLQFAILGTICSSSRAEFVVLYNGVGTPSSQLWLSYANNSILNGGSAIETPQASGVQLQTDLAVSAGYSNYLPTGQVKNALFPTLNRTNGFELAFSLGVGSENHVGNDRAGFSVTLLGSDARGIELGFWGDQIWAQGSNPIFTHGESVSINTSPVRDYRLQVQNNTYTLLANGNQILTGSVRDYTAFNAAPYILPNFLFLGDNTSSGAATVTLGSVTLQSNLSAVPEPSSFAMLGLVVVSALFIRYINVVSRLLKLYNRLP